MSLNYASLLHVLSQPISLFNSSRLDRHLDNDLITLARRADVSLPARPTHACTCYCKFHGNQGPRTAGLEPGRRDNNANATKVIMSNKLLLFSAVRACNPVTRLTYVLVKTLNHAQSKRACNSQCY